MQAGSSPQNDFPLTLDQVPPESRITETFGVTPGAAAACGVLVLVALLVQVLRPGSPVHVGQALLSFGGVLLGMLLLGAWEARRRKKRTSLVFSGDQLGIYHGNARMEVVSTNRITKCQVEVYGTVREILLSGTLAISALTLLAASLRQALDVTTILEFVAFSLASSAAFASSIYARFLCRHYDVPKGADSERVMFPERLDRIILRATKIADTEPRQQVVGSKCAHCAGNITTEAEAARCKRCEAPLHRGCRKEHRDDAHRPRSGQAYR